MYILFFFWNDVPHNFIYVIIIICTIVWIIHIIVIIEFLAAGLYVPCCVLLMPTLIPFGLEQNHHKVEWCSVVNNYL